LDHYIGSGLPSKLRSASPGSCANGLIDTGGYSLGKMTSPFAAVDLFVGFWEVFFRVLFSTNGD
jgi:hypothetical protein